MTATEQEELIRRSEALGLDPKQFRDLVNAVNRGYALLGLNLAVNVRDGLDRTIAHLIGECRQAGITWVQIGAVLGVSKQAAQKKYGDN